MSRVLAEGIGRVAVVTAGVPRPGPGQARVCTTLAGICGSDTHAVAGHHPLLVPPYYPGHEATGTVAELGDGVQNVAVGERVILKPNVDCGQCVNCLAGRTNACQQLRWVGCDPSGALPGAMSETFLAPAANLYPVPQGVTDEQAVLVECLATPVHAARIAGDLVGQRVAVLGAGTIGLFSVLVARQAGAESVVVTDLDPGKRKRALRHGADVALDPADQASTVDGFGQLADVVFDCVATETSVRQGVGILRRAGTLVIVGVPPRDFAVPMPLVQDRELRVQGSANYTHEDFLAAIEIARRLPAAEIITDRFPFADAARAFVRAGEASSGKVVVGPRT